MATTNARSAAWAKVRTASSVLLGLALIGYVMVTGIRLMAGLIAPGIWGYLGVAGYLTLVGPAPFLLLLNRNTRWVVRNLGPALLIGATTIALAVAGGNHGWPAWMAAAWILVLPTGYLVARGLASLPVRLTRRRAARLLRRRSAGTANAWSDDEWEWAFTQIGTPISLDLAARCQARQSLLRTTEFTTKRAVSVP
ncbi:hypothetical protein [Mycolicibacterium fortuitum]